MHIKEYPEIFYPTGQPANNNLIARQNFKSGFSESVFEAKLQKYFKDNLIVNHVINDGKKYPFYPDYILYFPDNNLIIDIELDEPYAYQSKKPIHIDDTDRNTYFLNNGWGIIRFAEIQTVRFPELCCKIISEYVRNITLDSIWFEGFHTLDDLDFIKAWTLDDAKNMAKDSYRNTYLTSLQKVIYEIPTINIIADGIYLNNQVLSAKSILENEESISSYNDTVQISLFINLLSKYLYNFESEKSLNGKIYVELTIYISKYHSFFSYSFDTDFIELDNYVINVYFIRTDKLICFEIMDKINDENLSQVVLIADDPAYPPLLEQLSLKKLILVRNYNDTFMSNNFSYISIDNLIEESLEIKYKSW